MAVPVSAGKCSRELNGYYTVFSMPSAYSVAHSADYAIVNEWFQSFPWMVFGWEYALPPHASAADDMRVLGHLAFIFRRHTKYAFAVIRSENSRLHIIKASNMQLNVISLWDFFRPPAISFILKWKSACISSPKNLVYSEKLTHFTRKHSFVIEFAKENVSSSVIRNLPNIFCLIRRSDILWKKQLHFRLFTSSLTCFELFLTFPHFSLTSSLPPASLSPTHTS